ncbi:MAG: thiamine transport system substrate-binding protein [Acidimicrobiaceae bacterium]
MRRTRHVGAAAIACALLVAACGSDKRPAADASSASATASNAGRGDTITLITHDSFAKSDGVLEKFTADTGIEVKILKGGDAGAVVNQAILTKDHPQGDVLYGIDNTLLSRGLDAGLFDSYTSSALRDLDPALDLDPAQHRVTPIDYSDVCVNIDKRAFGGAGQPAAPLTLDDLKNPSLKGKLVVENPATSSTGLAFLLATVKRYGENGYLDYWKALRANDVLVVDGWEQAYNESFTAGGASGDRPLVVSYATSPPADVFYAQEPKDQSDVGVVTDGCYRQVELAGVLHGTSHQAAAQKLVDFLASATFQADMPLQMFVFPARKGVALPDVFTKFAAKVTDPLQLPPDAVTANRERWIADWTAAVSG